MKPKKTSVYFQNVFHKIIYYEKQVLNPNVTSFEADAISN